MKAKLLDRILLSTLLFLGAGLYLHALGVRHLYAPDEPRFAEVVREMILTSDYLIPRVNGQVYPNKPPLYYWLAALFGGFQRVSETTVKLPSSISALFALMITYFLGVFLFHRRQIAFWGSLFLAVNVYFFTQARFVQMDMILLFFTLLSYYAFLRSFSSRSWLWTLTAYFSLGLSVLAKGPLGVILVGFGICTYLFFEKPLRDWPLLFFSLPHLFGFFLFLLTALSWNLAFLFTTEPHFFYEYFVRQNFGRFVGELKSHIRPFWYYFAYLPALLLPWTPFVPAFCLIFYQRYKENRIPKAVWQLLSWFLLGFVFFSLSKSKQAKYLLPFLPSLSLVMAWCLWHLKREVKHQSQKWNYSFFYVGKVLFALLAVLSLLGFFTSLFAFFPLPKTPPFPKVLELLLKHQGTLLALFLSTFLLSLLGLFGFSRQKVETLPYVLTFLFFSATTLGAPFFLSLLNQFKSAKFLAEKIKKTLEEKPAPWCMFGIYRSAFVFYTGKFCERIGASDVDKGLAKEDYLIRFSRFLKKHPRAYVLTDSYFATQFPSSFRPHLKLLFSRKVGKKHWQFYLWRAPR